MQKYYEVLGENCETIRTIPILPIDTDAVIGELEPFLKDGENGTGKVLKYIDEHQNDLNVLVTLGALMPEIFKKAAEMAKIASLVFPPEYRSLVAVLLEAGALNAAVLEALTSHLASRAVIKE